MKVSPHPRVRMLESVFVDIPYSISKIFNFDQEHVRAGDVGNLPNSNLTGREAIAFLWHPSEFAPPSFNSQEQQQNAAPLYQTAQVHNIHTWNLLPRTSVFSPFPITILTCFFELCLLHGNFNPILPRRPIYPSLTGWYSLLSIYLSTYLVSFSIRDFSNSSIPVIDARKERVDVT